MVPWQRKFAYHIGLESTTIEKVLDYCLHFSSCTLVGSLQTTLDIQRTVTTLERQSERYSPMGLSYRKNIDVHVGNSSYNSQGSADH